MKYEDLVSFINSQPMYERDVDRRCIPATNAQMEKLLKNGVLKKKSISVWKYGDKGFHDEIQYTRA